jgi:hypothetical protein
MYDHLLFKSRSNGGTVFFVSSTLYINTKNGLILSIVKYRVNLKKRALSIPL